MKKLSYIIDIFLVIIILFLGYVQVSMITSKSKNHGVPQVFGSSILYVATDSMEDPSNPKALNPGVGIIIQKVKPEDIKVSTPIYNETHDEIINWEKDGDIITFYWDKIKAPDTHRVIDKEYREEEGKYYFLTMGDNPIAHEKKIKEEFSEDVLIGKVTYSSKSLGKFLEIASPEAAAYYSARVEKVHHAWFFPVAIITPIVIIAITSVAKALVDNYKERKKRDQEIEEAMVIAGVDMNDEEAKELFRMKEEIRMDIKEEMEKEYKRVKAEVAKEMKKKGNKNEQ